MWKSMASINSKRCAIEQLYIAGVKPADIFKQLKGNGISRAGVYKIVKRLRDTGSASLPKRPGRPRSVRTPAMLKALKARIRTNPRRCQKKLALQMKTSRAT